MTLKYIRDPLPNICYMSDVNFELRNIIAEIDELREHITSGLVDIQTTDRVLDLCVTVLESCSMIIQEEESDKYNPLKGD